MEPGPALAPHPVRRFGLADGLILMVSVSFTLFVLRETGWFSRISTRFAEWWEISLELLRLRPWSFPSVTRGQVGSTLAIHVVQVMVIQPLSSILVGLTLAQPVLRLRRPRPPFREMIRQPGLALCLGMILGTLIVTDLSWTLAIDVLSRFQLALPTALLWPTLGMLPWRPEASWVDRLGRAVGWGWVLVSAAAVAIHHLGS